MKKYLAPVLFPIALFVLVMAFASMASADTANISFTAPTEREDNTPLAPEEIGGFNVFNEQGELVKQLPGDARSWTEPTTSAPQSRFVTTVDTDGRESVYSQQVTIPAGISDPKPVTGLTVTVTP